MANPERGEVALVVNGKEYTLRPRTNAIRDMERRSGKTYGQILGAIDQMSLEAVVYLLFAVLQPYHGAEFKTVDSVGDLLDDLGGYQHVISPLTQMLILNAPRRSGVPEERAANPLAAQAGTGDSSGSTPGGSA
jgi:hypothetical protein